MVKSRKIVSASSHSGDKENLLVGKYQLIDVLENYFELFIHKFTHFRLFKALRMQDFYCYFIISGATTVYNQKSNLTYLFLSTFMYVYI